VHPLGGIRLELVDDVGNRVTSLDVDEKVNVILSSPNRDWRDLDSFRDAAQVGVQIGSELLIDRGMTTLRSEDDVDEEIRKVCAMRRILGLSPLRGSSVYRASEPQASRHWANDLAPLRGCFAGCATIGVAIAPSRIGM
jgi:hypothetical protein